ncbi:hypothetical protein HHK36_029483 [Tetracentron sinense]|uniref:Pentatricopeptide repeat-containing protein n=1 Tax=Tetracentron sinense TaxID=13715 RepID=A0A835D1U1_TETSI|nr:hypothetical protein HHK36_029483 [Tetracentron sinense]
MKFSLSGHMFEPVVSSRRFFLIFHTRNCFRSISSLLVPSIAIVFVRIISGTCSPALSPSRVSSQQEILHCIKTSTGHQEQQYQDSTKQSYLEALITKVHVGNSEDEVFQSLLHDQTCDGIQLSNQLVNNLLHRFRDDWKSALGLFRWAGLHSGYKHTPEAYDMIVDILGKMKQMNRMLLLVEEMRQGHLITLKTIAKVMRRLAGAGRWEDAIKTFDDLGTFSLEKNTESMNLLLDTLCKEKKVELARNVFLELKSHISPNAYTFNIFIHGWCKANRVDEAHWTIQEMIGNGCRPCVISYSTIIRAYCNQSNFRKVYEILDEMQAQACPPNVITYTTIMCSLAKSDEFEEALKIGERMKSVGCKPDTLYYNSLIHILGRAGRLREAAHVFEVEMPLNAIAPNSSTYNSMISLFCHHSQEQNALDVLKEMENSTFCKPEVQTYYPLLKMCFKTGRTDSTLSNLLNDMVSKHHLSLDLSTYTLLLHGLCRANKCEWAYLLFEEMISKEITPRYQTCRLLLDEVKDKNLYDVAERIEVLMKQMKA